MKFEEQEQQSYLFQWAAFISELKWLHGSMNGAKRSKSEIITAKKLGLKPGISDIFLPKARYGYHGLYVEMKCAKGKISKEQQEFIDDMLKEGYLACVCWTWIEAKEVIEKYLMDLL